MADQPAQQSGSAQTSDLQVARRSLHRVSVTGIETLTPHMRRFTFEGEALGAVRVPLPAQWLKIVLSGPDSASENRAYTIRRFYPGWNAMEIDMVLHGDAGPASRWARRAEIGDVVHLGSPRGGFEVDLKARWRLLAGDETALPAIAGILEALPADGVVTRVFVEVPTSEDALPLGCDTAAEVHWLARDRTQSLPGLLLQDQIASTELASETGQVFLAGEATAVRRIKQDLVRRALQATIDAKGYWMVGQADLKGFDKAQFATERQVVTFTS